MKWLIWRLFGRVWVVRRSGWPYRGGWATFIPHTNTIVDTGLSRSRSEAIVREENQQSFKEFWSPS